MTSEKRCLVTNEGLVFNLMDGWNLSAYPHPGVATAKLFGLTLKL